MSKHALILSSAEHMRLSISALSPVQFDVARMKNLGFQVAHVAFMLFFLRHALYERNSVHWPATQTEEQVSSRGSSRCFLFSSFHIGLRLFLLLRPLPQGTVVLDALECKMVGLFPGRTDLSASRPAWPHSARPPRLAPRHPDPPMVCPGFGFGTHPDGK